jgi:hypothetical protein
MKALTLTQPWATLVAIGAKTIETRSWPTKYRGPLAIHAAKGFPEYARERFFNWEFREPLEAAGYKSFADLPLGVIVATCELVKVEEIVIGSMIPLGGEWHFGDYSYGRYMWHLKNVQALPTPILARGALSLWEWDASSLATT